MKLGQLTSAVCEYHRASGRRPTVKFQLREPSLRCVTFLWGRAKNRINLPGGGVEYKEHPPYAGLCELRQELGGYLFTIEDVLSAELLAEGQVPTTRDGFSHKHLWIFELVVPNLTHLHPVLGQSDHNGEPIETLFGTELRDKQVHSSPESAAARIWSSDHTKPEAASLYIQALKEISRRAKR